MSHFVVMVIGEDVEGQLAPYSEELQVEPYFEEAGEYCWETAREKLGTDVTPEAAAEYLTKKWEEEHIVQDGKLGYMTPSNPQGFWDWWTIGGRWPGLLPLKEGVQMSPGHVGKPGAFNEKEYHSETYGKRRADSAKLEDIDFERGRREMAEKAQGWFAEWKAVYERYGKPKAWSDYRTLVEDGHMDIKEARDKYHAQEAIKKSNGLIWECPVDFFGYDEEAYVAKEVAGMLKVYAVVKDGKWTGQGHMGWFGMSHDDMNQEKWDKHIQDLLNDLPPEIRITMVDCHI